MSITVSHILTGACTRPCLREYFSGRVWWSWKLKYFWLLYSCYCDQRIFHFGRVDWSCNEQCYLWWGCHSFELGIDPMALLGGSAGWWLSLGLITDRLPLRSWFKFKSALVGDNSFSISKSRSPAFMVHFGGCGLSSSHVWYWHWSLGPLQTLFWLPGFDGTLQ